jgi:hypothetical protein
MSNPITPYAGTSGHSGVDTSEERARTSDSDGTTSRLQRMCLDALAMAGVHGRASWEIEADTGEHHGKVSGALSVLHKTGKIACLVERRGRAHPYVLPEHVNNRETRPHGGKRATPKVDRLADLEERYTRAIGHLKEVQTGSPVYSRDYIRLGGKIEGMKLALGYLQSVNRSTVGDTTEGAET